MSKARNNSMINIIQALMSIGVSTIHFRNTAPKRYRAEPNRAARGGGKGGGGGVEGGMGSGGGAES